jgi:hypothetical protein
MTVARSLPRAVARSFAFALALAAPVAGCVLETNLGHWAAPDSDADASADAASHEPNDGGIDDPACTPASLDAGTCAAVADGSLLTVTPGATTSYFAAGKSLPAGDYTLAYVDGCWHSGVVSWTVNLGDEGYSVVGGQPEQRIAMAPGTIGTFASGLGAYAMYDECVGANMGRPGISFHFEGGPLGLKMQSLDPLAPLTLFILVDGGESVGGVSPTFRLTCTGECG